MAHAIYNNVAGKGQNYKNQNIISGCGSITENISLFIDHHSKHLVLKTPSYLQNTPDLLSQIEKYNETPLPPHAFAVSIDVVGLYQNMMKESNTLENPLTPEKIKQYQLTFSLPFFNLY
jgi:hypothetical protein